MREILRVSAVCLLLCLFLGASLFAHQSYTLKFPNYRVEIDPNGYHKLTIKGYSSYGVAGYPDLPSRLYRIAVPPEVVPGSISVSYAVDKMDALGFMDIAEIPPMMTWADDRYIYEEKED
ncbi:MAG: hypothetical protein JXB23_12560, partial [Candidatus Aminicenantes bacterium]|nr:hypothetical protein [Candidatus Aminicenantes bacterium]